MNKSSKKEGRQKRKSPRESWRSTPGNIPTEYAEEVYETLKRKLLAGLLPPRSRKIQKPFFIREKHPEYQHICQRFKDANVVGIGIGAKESSGKISGQLAICVYVTKKQECSKLGRHQRIPKEIDGYQTDVIPVGRLALHQSRFRLGAPISLASTGPGTLGCLIEIPGKAGVHLLTAAHVIAPDSSASVNDPIFAPPSGVSGSAPLAILSDWEPLFRGDGVNTIDAAVALLSTPSDVSSQPPLIENNEQFTIDRPIQSSPVDPYIFQSVWKYGGKTAHSLGVITQRKVDIRLGDLTYSDVWMILGAGGRFSEKGDSGALVIDAQSNSPVGLLIGGGGARTFMVPIKRILGRFGNASILTNN